MQVFDSSVWIALFIDSDVHHVKAINALEEAVGQIYVPYIVVEETFASRMGLELVTFDREMEQEFHNALRII